MVARHNEAGSQVGAELVDDVVSEDAGGRSLIHVVVVRLVTGAAS